MRKRKFFSVGLDQNTALIVENTGGIIGLVKKKYGLVQYFVAGQRTAAHIGVNNIGTVVVSCMQGAFVGIVIGVEVNLIPSKPDKM